MKDSNEIAADKKWRSSLWQRPELRLIVWYILAAVVWELAVSEIIIRLPVEHTSKVFLSQWEPWGFVALSMIYLYFFTRAWVSRLRKSRQILHNYFHNSPTVHYELRVLDSDYRVYWVSPNCERVMGYSSEEVKEPDWWLNNIHPKDRELALKTALRGFDEPQFVYEYRFRHKSGHYVWVRDEVRCINKKPLRFQGSWTNISNDLAESPEVSRETGEYSTRSGFVLLDESRHILKVDTLFTDISGLSQKDCSSSKLEELLTVTDLDDISEYFPCNRALLVIGRNAERKRYSGILSIRELSSDVLGKVYYVATLTDVTAIKQQQKQLQRLAFFDDLTGLPNTNSLALDLARLLDELPDDRLAAVLVLNIDHFHRVNDTYGHHVGDKILQRLTQRLKDSVPFGTKVYNVGGDEFAIVLNQIVEYIDIEAIIRQLQQAYEQPFALPQGKQVTLSASIGTSVYPLDGHDASKLVARAQLAMNSAKDQQADNSSFFTQELAQSNNDAERLEEDARSVLQTDQMQLVYQPILTMDGKLVGAEVLTRWEHPELGTLSPYKFLPLFDANKMLDIFGIWVIEQVITQIEQWHENGIKPEKIAINLATEQISPLLYDTLNRLTQDKPQLVELLEFELSESTLHEPLEQTLDIIDKLHKLGVSLVIDRFGKGIGSMLHLKTMPASKVKIEREFIQELDTNERAAELVKAMIDMTLALGLKVQAVGVENEAQLEKLKAFGCHYWQGRLYKLAESGDTVFDPES